MNIFINLLNRPEEVWMNLDNLVGKAVHFLNLFQFVWFESNKTKFDVNLYNNIGVLFHKVVRNTNYRCICNVHPQKNIYLCENLYCLGQRIRQSSPLKIRFFLAIHFYVGEVKVVIILFMPKLNAFFHFF